MFYVNIEEKSIVGVIKICVDVFCYVYILEND